VARPKSEDKRNAILEAATRLFAERGLYRCSNVRDIETSWRRRWKPCLTYFETKDDLINALYQEIKLELADAMMSDFPRKKNVRSKLQHVWDRYVNWGIAHPKQRKALAQLQVSEALTKSLEKLGGAPFVEFQTMIRDAIDGRVFRHDLPGGNLSRNRWQPWWRQR